MELSSVDDLFGIHFKCIDADRKQAGTQTEELADKREVAHDSDLSRNFAEARFMARASPGPLKVPKSESGIFLGCFIPFISSIPENSAFPW